ncbi:MAG: tRNA dihydrouridine synthase DusB [Acidimicrobiales bacterium]
MGDERTSIADPPIGAPSATAPTAGPGEFAPLAIGPLEIWPPVVLAPMAGVTNAPFRRLCRRYGAGLYVSEMVNARGLIEGGAKSWELAAFDADESPRSIQLYGTDPATMRQAVRRLVEEGHVDHIDLNFGCPVRKVTRHGGGSALTAKPGLLAAVVAATVDAAGDVPVTVKVRKGIDDDLSTFLDAGRIAQDAGAAAIALHARTAAQLYSGRADWSAIARLKAAVTIPVLGNGDVWQATDAVRMLRQTGADGVVVGRGCLGRPWMFRDLVDVFDGRPPRPAPPLGEVTAVLVEHARLLTAWRGEQAALRDLRKHTGWYLTGYPVGGDVRRALSVVATLDELETIVDGLDPTMVALAAAVGTPRGTQAGPQQVTLPAGWLDHRDDLTPPPALADALVSGG